MQYGYSCPFFSGLKTYVIHLFELKMLLKVQFEIIS